MQLAKSVVRGCTAADYTSLLGALLLAMASLIGQAEWLSVGCVFGFWGLGRALTALSSPIERAVRLWDAFSGRAVRCNGTAASDLCLLAWAVASVLRHSYCT